MTRMGMLFTTCFVVCPVLLSSVLAQGDAFDWTLLPSRDDVKWVSCYDTMQCARFNVPLNYSNPSAGNASIAMIQLPANISKSSAEYGGPMFFNPGGPGGSGIEFMQEDGTLLQDIVGPTFDIVSFDPRGVGRSTPQASFFKNHIDRAFWDFGPDTMDMNSTQDAIPRQMARFQVLGQMAQARDSSRFLQHVTTDNVARDMLAMTNALGTDKLKYWGISYGTVLGATYAALFPDKFDRLIIDGVVDAEAWYSNNWTTELHDTDKTLQTFFDGCFAAGPSNCAFYANSSDQIKQNLNDLMISVFVQPILAYSNTSELYGIVDYATLRTSIFYSLYSPYSAFQPLSDALVALQQGDGLPIYEIVAEEIGFTTPNADQCNFTFSGPDFENSYEAEIAIACADGLPVPNDVASMKAFAANARNVSIFSDFVVGDRVKCSGWNIHPLHFSGPISGNTTVPMLVIGNTADPVAPLTAAELTSTRFPGSIVLVQDSPGHSSFTASSTCTAGYIRSYLVNATLPTNGTVCSVDQELFPSLSSTNPTATTFFSSASPSSTVSSKSLKGRGSKWLTVTRHGRGMRSL